MGGGNFAPLLCLDGLLTLTQSETGSQGGERKGQNEGRG